MRRRAQPNGGAWPNLFVVGAGKAGTTTLVTYLDRHPEIFMSRVKEPHYFSRYKPTLFPSVSDTEAYLRLFAAGARARFRGEATASYIWDEDAPDAIRAVVPDARIVITLRNPVERAYSHYWSHVRFGRERRPFLEVVETEIGNPTGVHTASPCIDRSLYADRVGRYLRAFPHAVHVLFFEELVADPRAGMRALYEFLGVEAGVAERLRPERRNPGALPRGRAAGMLIGSASTRRAARAVVPLRFREPLERLLLGRREATPPIDPRARTLLERRYADDVARLERLLGRRTPWTTWSER